jgi:hypothetical protein
MISVFLQIEYDAAMPTHVEDLRFVEQDQHHRRGTDAETIEHKASISRRHRHSQFRDDAPPAYQPRRPSDSHIPQSFHRREIAIPENPLRRLLSGDLDAYVNSHTDKYETEQKRWEGCTMEEWVAGADGEYSFSNAPIFPCIELT